MTNKKDKAIECFSKGFNCAQSVFSTYSSMFGINSVDALKIACGLGAGMGRLQKTCGAITGAVLLIGLKHGIVREEDKSARGESKEITYDLVRKFTEEFKVLNGSTECRELLGCDLSTPEGLQFAKENNLFKLKCEKYVGDAAELIEKILFQNGSKVNNKSNSN